MLRAIVVGLGPIGINCARAVQAQRGMELAGLVDVDPAKAGLALHELANRQDQTKPGNESEEPERGPGPRVTADLAAAARGADVAILTTTSRFDRVARTIRECLAQHLAVVSSCEEMAWPWYAHVDLARQIDAEAKQAGKAVLGTGVNPGFVMDSLAVTLASVVRRVTAVRCLRRVDATLRRPTLQAKVGATMKPEEFAALARAGKLGHVGIAESVALLAAGLGQPVAPGSVTVILDPVLAQQPVRCALGLIEPGRVAGLHNTARWTGDDLTIELDLTMACGLPEPRDEIELAGPVQVKMKIPGGLQGDAATVAVLINYARVVAQAAPGLRTMLDLPPAGCYGRDE